jgi:hypothetical protein
LKNSSKEKEKIRLYELVSPGRQIQKSEFNKNNKLIMNTNPNNNTNSVSNINPLSPSNTTYNISFNNKKIQKILNSRKNNSQGKNH